MDVNATADMPDPERSDEGPGPPGLVVLYPGRPDPVVSIDRPRTVGRLGGGGDVELDHSTVSRQHARITPDADGMRVEDLGSRNGTRKNGAQLQQPVALRPGDVLGLGAAVLVCVADADAYRHALRRAVGPLVGGPALDGARRLIDRFGPSGVPVLIEGETGTGKEVVARALHDASGRAGAYVPVNCAALPPTLFESEAFGVVRGAFTGADRDRPGLLRQADGGTAMLDEIGELPAECQAKLLRALEEGCVRPLGADRPVPVDLRVVAATNRVLATEVAAGRFRRDLYQRLAGETLRLPPLRERREDIGALIAHFAQPGDPPWSGRALERACLHDWPGNVRELLQIARAAAVQARADGARAVEAGHLPAALATPAPEAELARVEGALRAHGGNVSRAAQALGLRRPSVYEVLRRHGRDPKQYR